MFRNHAIIWIALLIGGTASGTARAAIVDLTDDFVQIAPPPSVQEGNLEDDNDLFIFEETAGVFLSDSLAVGVNQPGTYGPNEDTSGFPQSVIPRGTRVKSYLVHADPVGSSQQDYSGTVTFGQNILGIMFDEDRLLNSHGLLGAPGTEYGNERFFISGPTDQFELDANQRSITVRPSTGTNTDQLRIITAIPEPAYGGMFISLITMSAWSLRRKRA